MAHEVIERLAATPVLYREKRVITLRMMDDLHERPEGTAGRNFRENKDKLIEGADFFELNQGDEIRRLGLGDRPQGGIANKVVLLTESGYLLLVKSFRDDLAWRVQRELVNAYFRAKEEGTGDTLLDSLKGLVLLRESQLVLERRTKEVASLAGEAKQIADAAMAKVECNHGYFSILGYARMHGLTMPVDKAGMHGKRLTASCINLGIPVHKVKDQRFGFVNIYPESVLEEYFATAVI